MTGRSRGGTHRRPPNGRRSRLRTNVRTVGAIVRRGGVVGYAVEACFGLGCDPRNRRALARLLRLKGRPAAKGLILIAGRERALLRYASELPARACATWPGPHTWLVPAHPRLAAAVRGRHAEVAVRVTAHAQAALLARLSGGAIVSTSANRSRERPARSYRELSRRLGYGLDAILVGRTGALPRPTPIRHAHTGEYTRP
ncbi:MAG TPA: Sua5/YciO/YrdC/YwlC family protein [Acidiferrobacter sp.]|nr:Sua5/YciO/YrdC/YwlC family protein [Acidiferrobacter sp.]